DVEGKPDNLIYFKAGEVNSNVYTADVRHTPVGDFSNLTIKIPVYVQQPVSNATRVTVALDNSLVDAYNEEKGTNYPLLPDAAIELLKTTVTLDANEYSSTDSIEAQLTENLLATLTEPEYMTAFRITDVNGSGKASEERGIIYVKVQTGTDYIHVTDNDEVIGSIAHTPVGSLGNVSIDLPAYVNQAAKVGATATITVDNSLVAEYNAEHGTNYPAAPNGVLNIENASVTIAQGETSSATNFKAAIPSDKMAQLTGPQYLIPLHISAKRTDGSTVDNAGVIYMIFTTSETLVNSNATEPLGTMIATSVMSTWTATNASTGANMDMSLMTNDTSNNRYWNTGTYIIDMKEVHNVSSVGILSYYGMYGYYPDHLGVEISEDGSNWTEVGYVSGGDYYETGSFVPYGRGYGYMVFYGGVPARYLRLDMAGIWASYPVLAFRVWEQ
ncbi:MAG: DUF1735 domain-containing protein, partial [Prevotella sp.]|nr:DUF1735 domain-containing protein [Prevotella sp.]